MTDNQNELNFQWNGNNIDDTMSFVALQLLIQVKNYKFTKSENLYFVNHLHSENFRKLLISMYDCKNKSQVSLYLTPQNQIKKIML